MKMAEVVPLSRLDMDRADGGLRTDLYEPVINGNRTVQFGSDENRDRGESVDSKAHVHALSEQYESLDYEIVENDLYRKEETTPNHQTVLSRQSLNRWVVCFLIGVLTALVACFIDIMVHYTSLFKFNILRSLFADCSKKRRLWIPLLAWWAFNSGFVAIASSLVVFVAGSVAAGSGIPQIKCFLNGVMIPGVVRMKTLLAKAVGVAFSVAGGLSVGKEGPMIHSGAVVAAGISQGRCITIPFDFKMFEYFRSDREKRDFVSAGAAAGVSAAFGAPIGGVLFSLEEGASFWKQALTWRIFFGSMVSMFTLSAVLSALYHKAGQLSWSGLANFGVFQTAEYQIWEITLFLLIGVLGGLLGALFNYINYKLSIFRMHFFVKPWQKFLEALLVASMSATVAFLTVYFIEDCQPLGKNRDNTTRPIQLGCKDGEYSAVAEIYFRTPEEGVKSLFHSPPGSYRPLTLLVFAVGYFLLSTWTYGLSVPSGLFIPTLLTGAAWGRLIGIGVQSLFPHMEGLDPGKYALAGAAAQLGGVVRMTISLCAIIIEATHNITFGLPIMLILMMAKWVGDYFNEGLYDIHIELAEVPLLGWEPPKPSSNILAKRIMQSNMVVFRPVEKVGQIYDTLVRNKHHGYPIVDDWKPEEWAIGNFGRLNGLILRSQLITLLQHRMFSFDENGDSLVDGARKPKLEDFRDAYPRYNVQLHHITLSDEDRDCWMDLRPYMNPQPYRVEVCASLPSIFQLFRGLGLRNLVVVDKNNRVRGIITRKDLARFKEVRRGREQRVREIYISD